MLIPHQKPTPKISDVFFGTCNYLVRRKTNFRYLKKNIPKGNYYWTSSGRNALYWILKNENVNNVYLPSFTCNVVLDAIKITGKNIIFIDSDYLINIKNFKKIIKNGKSALVLPYNFGFLPEIDEIVKICKKNNIVLIEDCAQALGAIYKGKLAGSFGDYSFFSFGISKNIGFGNGLIVSKKRLLINNKYKYPLMKTLQNITQAKASSIFFSSVFYEFFYPILKKKTKITNKFTNFKASELAKYIVMQQSKRYHKILKNRKDNAEYCMKNLKIDFVRPIKDTDPAWLYFVIKSKNRDKLRKKLFKEKVDVQPLLTFNDLNNSRLSSKFEKEHLIFALYRSKKEIRYIVNKINKWK